MPGENIFDWSTTAATNANADSSINWAEGQTRASVNNSARSMMAALAKKRNLTSGVIATGGTANAQTFTSGLGYTSIPTGLRVTLRISAGTNTGATTLNMDGIGAVTVFRQDGTALIGGELRNNNYVSLLYNGTGWIYLGDYVLRSGDTMTGDLTVTKADPTIILNKTAAAQNPVLRGRLNGVERWAIIPGENTAESGSNAGSNLSIQNYSDAGALLGIPLTIRRSDGQVAVGKSNGGGFTNIAECEFYFTANATSGFGGIYRNDISGTRFPFVWYNSGASQVGFISASDTATAYATSSDARLKYDDTPFTRGRELVDALPVKEFTWKADDSAGVGLMAQDVGHIVPGAVSQAPDGTYGIDYSKYVPALIQALQEAHARIDALEERLTK